jgi:hypothetical protein
MRKNALDEDDVCELVHRLLQRAHSCGDVSPKEAVVLVGGAALCLNGIRESSGDIDLYGPRKLRDHARVLEAQLRSQYGPHFAIDVTSEPNIWGRLKVPEIDRSRELKTIHVGHQVYALRALDPETLFVIKNEAGREKDIFDLELIARHTTAEAIIERWTEIMAANPEAPRLESGANLLAEISAQYLCEIKPAWIRQLGLGGDEEEELRRAFLSRSRLAAEPDRLATP